MDSTNRRHLRRMAICEDRRHRAGRTVPADPRRLTSFVGAVSGAATFCT